MKYFFFSAIIAFSIIAACNDGKNPSVSTETQSIKDTVSIAEVNTFINNVDQEIQAAPPPSVTSFELNGGIKEMSYYGLPNGMQYWHAKVSEEGNESYVALYLKNEEPWLFRFREWDKIKTNTASEFIMYFKNGKIFYAKERSGLNMSPIQLMLEPHADTKKSIEELYAIFNQYYPFMHKAWEDKEK